MMKIVTRSFGLAMGILGLIGVAGEAKAQSTVPDRPALNAILGASAVTENFEGFSISDGNALVLGTTTLNSTTVTDGQGPGLVIGGFSISSGELQWNGNGYFGLSTKSVSGDNPLTIDFTSLTRAFGVDLETYSGFPNTFNATVYATDNTTVIGTITGISVPTPSPVFFGFQDTAGIGSVTFSDTSQPFSPVLDNLEFGSGAIPEPSSIVLASAALVMGLVYSLRRRKRLA
jgi:hypothetical protein